MSIMYHTQQGGRNTQDEGCIADSEDLGRQNIEQVAAARGDGSTSEGTVGNALEWSGRRRSKKKRRGPTSDG